LSSKEEEEEEEEDSEEKHGKRDKDAATRAISY